MTQALHLLLNAGGQSRRMGRPKALLPTPPHGQPLVLSILQRLQSLPIVRTSLIGGDPAFTSVLAAQLAHLTAISVVPDSYPGCGALGGLATGLQQCGDWAIAVACDMPLVKPALFAYLLMLTNESADGQSWQAIVPRIDGHAQPFHALYHPTVLPSIAAQLQRNDLRVHAFLQTIRTRWVLPEEAEPFDPAFHSFVNVNTPAEWQAACQLLSAEARAPE